MDNSSVLKKIANGSSNAPIVYDSLTPVSPTSDNTDVQKQTDELTRQMSDVSFNLQSIVDYFKNFIFEIKDLHSLIKDEKNYNNLVVPENNININENNTSESNTSETTNTSTGSGGVLGFLFSLLKNPKTILLSLVSAIGYGLYKYFTDDEFKKTVFNLAKPILRAGDDFIIKPIKQLFFKYKDGLYTIMADTFEKLASVSISIPKWLVDLGMPNKLTPFSFLTGTAQNLRNTVKNDQKLRAEAEAKEEEQQNTLTQDQQTSFSPIGTPTPSNSSFPISHEGNNSSGPLTDVNIGPLPSITGSDRDVMDFIKSNEGVRYTPYRDSAGLWTVGVGHLIGDGTFLPPEMNRRFSSEEVDALFIRDYDKHKKAAEKIPGYNNAGREGQAGLIDMTFNMGPNWYKTWPNFVKSLSIGNISGVVGSMVNSSWFNQVKGRAVKVINLLKAGLSKSGGQSLPASSYEMPIDTTKPSGTSAFYYTQNNQTSNNTMSPAQAYTKVRAGNVSPNRSSGSLVSPAQMYVDNLRKQPAAITEPKQSYDPGASIGKLTTAIKEHKGKSTKDTIVVDKSRNSQSQMSSLIAKGSIPPPIANRGFLDSFNFFNPPGRMKD